MDNILFLVRRFIVLSRHHIRGASNVVQNKYCLEKNQGTLAMFDQHIRGLIRMLVDFSWLACSFSLKK